MTGDVAGLGQKKRSKTPGAEVLATFFTEKFQIPGEESAVVPHLENEDFTTNLKTFRVKRNRVQQVLEKLDESKSVGLDGVSPRVLKQCATVLSVPLTRLFQMIARSRIYPQTWKVARVTPHPPTTGQYLCYRHCQPLLRECSYHSLAGDSSSTSQRSNLVSCPTLEQLM